MNVQFRSKFLNNFSRKRYCNLLSFSLSLLPVISIVFRAKKIRKYLIFFDRNSKEISLRKCNAQFLAGTGQEWSCGHYCHFQNNWRLFLPLQKQKHHSSLNSQPKFMKSGSLLSCKNLVSEKCTVHVI